MRYLFIFLTLSFCGFAHGADYTIAASFSGNSAMCGSYRTSLQTLTSLEEAEKKRPEHAAVIQDLKNDVIKDIRAKSQYEAAVVALSVKTPAVLEILNLDMNVGGSSVARARVNAPVLGAVRTENRLELPSPGSATIQVVFTMAGLCPFLEDGVSQKIALEKALRSVIK